jgi:hypothetical protein
MTTTNEAQQSAAPEPQRFDPRWIIARNREILLASAPDEFRPQLANAFDVAYRVGFELDDAIKHALQVLDERDRLREEASRTGGLEPTEANVRAGIDLYLTPAILLGTAARLLEAGDVTKAWCVCDLAAQFIESLRWREGERFVAAMRGTKAMQERHKGTRANQEFVRRWYAKHKAQFRSKDEAAEYIVNKELVFASVKTVRKWLKERKTDQT